MCYIKIYKWILERSQLMLSRCERERSSCSIHEAENGNHSKSNSNNMTIENATILTVRVIMITRNKRKDNTDKKQTDRLTPSQTNKHKRWSYNNSTFHHFLLACLFLPTLPSYSPRHATPGTPPLHASLTSYYIPRPQPRFITPPPDTTTTKTDNSSAAQLSTHDSLPFTRVNWAFYSYTPTLSLVVVVVVY